MSTTPRLRATAHKVFGKLRKPKARHTRAAVAPVDSQILGVLGLLDGATVADVVSAIRALMQGMQSKIRQAMVRDDAQRAVAAALNVPLSRIRKDAQIVRRGRV